MKALRSLLLLCLAIFLFNPISRAFASISAQESVTASAVVVPVRVTELSFIIPGLIKEISIKKGEQVKAGQMLATLDTPELQLAVTAADAALRSAQGQAELQRYQRVKNIRKGKVVWDELPGELLDLANMKVMQTQAALEMAQATLAQSVLTAPYDGTVAGIDIVPGEFVQPNQVVITLATLNSLQLETTDLSERDVTRVKIGAPVNIFIDALGENLTGKAVAISPRANTVGGDVVFKITIAFDKQPENLLWGMTTEVTIEE